MEGIRHVELKPTGMTVTIVCVCVVLGDDGGERGKGVRVGPA